MRRDAICTSSRCWNITLYGSARAADHAVEADAGEAVLALQLVARFGDQHDVGVGRHDRPGELGVPTGEPDVDRLAQVTVCELLGVAAVDQHGAGVERVDHLARSVIGAGASSSCEQLAVLAVEDRVVDEVPGRRRLALGDEAP